MSKVMYSSDEMFSSTDLVRKSKLIFDAIILKKIDKAVILRDGKPSFIMLDFFEYEKIMKEYFELKNISQEISIAKELKEKPTQTPQETQNENIIQNADDEIKNDELQKALEEIDNIDFSIKPTVPEKANIKEFWDE